MMIPNVPSTLLTALVTMTFLCIYAVWRSASAQSANCRRSARGGQRGPVGRPGQCAGRVSVSCMKASLIGAGWKTRLSGPLVLEQVTRVCDCPSRAHRRSNRCRLCKHFICKRLQNGRP